MGGRFPHLKGDNDFPGTANVRPFEQYRNEFDYERWSANVTLTLYNVPWDADGRNVVKFEGDAARDDWFKGQQGRPLKLPNAIGRRPDDSIKLPLPFDELQRYNYLVVDYGVATSASQPLDYETGDGFTRHYYFITSVEYAGPSTTVARLQNDFWTTYVNKAEVPMLMLERGHWPVAHSNVDSYLSNPADNSSYLVTPDVTYGGDTLVKGSVTVPLDAGDKWVCLAVAWDVSRLGSMGEGAKLSDPSAPTFADLAGAQGGAQARENVSYSFFDRSYRGLWTLVSPYVSQDGVVANNVCTVALPAAQASGYLSALQDRCAYLMQDIVACFVVSSDMVSLSPLATHLGYQLYRCVGGADVAVSVELTKDMFAVPAPYADLAKLYTYPYSTLEWAAPDGTVVEIRPENTGALSIAKEFCVAWPWLNVQAGLRGVNGGGASTYSARRLDGSNATGSVANDDYLQCLYQYDIPTYELRFEAACKAKIAASTNLFSAELQEKNDYSNTVTGANTSNQNTLATNATANANAKRSNATAQANANRSNATAKANADASADTDVANQARSNTASTNNTSARNSTNDAVTTANRGANTRRTALNNAYNNSVTSTNNQTSQMGTDIEGVADSLATAATASGNTVAGMIGGAVGGFVAGGPAGAAMGAAGGAVNGIVGGMTASTATSLAISKHTRLVNWLAQGNTALAGLSEDVNDALLNVSNDLISTVAAANNSLASTVTANSNAAGLGNANASAATAKANASRSQATGDANAAATRSTGDANADATKATADSNAGRSLSQAVQARQRSAHTSWQARNVESQGGRLEAHTSLGSYSGDATPTEDMRNAVQLRVRTQSQGALMQSGAYFSRYGYAWAGLVDLTDLNDLNQMSSFSYWKASEVWVTGDRLIESARDGIERILLQGTTVWRRPEDIGSVKPNAQL